LRDDTHKIGRKEIKTGGEKDGETALATVKRILDD